MLVECEELRQPAREVEGGNWRVHRICAAADQRARRKRRSSRDSVEGIANGCRGRFSGLKIQLDQVSGDLTGLASSLTDTVKSAGKVSGNCRNRFEVRARA